MISMRWRERIVLLFVVVGLAYMVACTLIVTLFMLAIGW